MNTACHILHQRLSELPRFCFDGEKKQTLNNGIYIVFEKAMTAHGADRIVHIGTHYSSAGLSRRINNHPSNHNKSSVLRRHIGQAILNERNGPPLKCYESVDLDEINKEIGCYIKNKLKFFIMDFGNNEDERVYMKSRLLSTIKDCSHCKPTKKWLGVYHPSPTIRKSGLWNIQGLNKAPLSPEEAQALVVR